MAASAVLMLIFSAGGLAEGADPVSAWVSVPRADGEWTSTEKKPPAGGRGILIHDQEATPGRLPRHQAEGTRRQPGNKRIGSGPPQGIVIESSSRD